MIEGKTVAVLFARVDSVYKELPGCDVWDWVRDALLYRGELPVVAHPPCRAWGKLRAMAKPREGEKELAFFAVDQVRRCGGVLEHPAASLLWGAAGLPEPGRRDDFGGFTLVAPQKWWGHKAEKLTRFYVVGVEPRAVPAMPLDLREAEYVVTSGSIARGTAVSCGGKRGITKREREATSRALAQWLVELARRCRKESGGDE